MVNSLASKTVLITGANSGIGAAMALAFAHCGARIGLHYLEAASLIDSAVRIGHRITGHTGAERVAAEVRALGAAVVLAPADLADAGAIAVPGESPELPPNLLGRCGTYPSEGLFGPIADRCQPLGRCSGP